MWKLLLSDRDGCLPFVFFGVIVMIVAMICTTIIFATGHGTEFIRFLNGGK